jgi:hypothetical protein
MITEAMIEAALDDIDEDVLETHLAESELFLYSLAKAIVCMAVANGPIESVSVAVNECALLVREEQRRIAEKAAQDKDSAQRFQCQMLDDDWDDLSRRMTA